MVSNKTFLYFLALPGIFASGFVFAQSIPQPNDARYYNGFFVGAGVGGNAFSSQIKNTSTFAITSLAPTSSPSKISAYDNRGTIIGTLEAGYGHLANNNIYLGVTGFLDFADRKTNHFLNMERLGGATQRDKKSSSTSLASMTGGVTFDPGFLISPNTLFTTMLGWERADADVKGYQFVNVISSSHGEHHLSKKQSIDGLRLGVGFLEHATPALSFGVRYVYTNFSKGLSTEKTTQLTGGALTGPFTYDVKSKNIASQSVMFNMRYYWGNSGAAPAPYTHDSNSLNGFYIAGQLGAMIPNMDEDTTTVTASYYDRGTNLNTANVTTSQPKQNDSPAVKVAIGKASIFKNQFHVALEGLLDWSDKDINSNLTQAFRPTAVSVSGQEPDSIKHKISASLNDVEPAIDLKLGFLLNRHLLPYLRVGAAINEVKYKVTNQLIYINDNNVSETFVSSGKDNKDLSAHLRLGAGMEYQHSHHDTFSLNYVYTNYGNYKVTTNENYTDTAGNPVTLSDSSRVSLKNNVLSIGYTHYFGS